MDLGYLGVEGRKRAMFACLCSFPNLVHTHILIQARSLEAVN
jgi:hypothetical protein